MKESHSNNLLSIAALIIILAVISLAQAIVVPFLLALFIAIIASLPITWLCKRGLPPIVAVSFVLILVVGFLLSASLILAGSIDSFSQMLPVYAGRLQGYTKQTIQLFSVLGVKLPEEGILGAIQPEMALHFINSLLGGITQLLSNTFLIVMTVVFMLLEASEFSHKIELIRDDAGKSVSRIADFINDIRHYMAIKTAINLGTGILITAGLSLLGVDNAILWGFLFFFLSYIPTIGSVIAIVPTVLMALLQLGIGPALIVTGYILVIKMLIGNVIEPRVTGRGVGLSTLVVFLSMVFWGWLLGPVGMLLSVPLTMWVHAFASTRDNLHWISILLSSQNHASPQSHG